MTYLSEILDVDLLNRHIEQGNIRTQTHPEFPELTIYNYTEQAQFSRNWDEVTKTCRGLIVHGEEVLARPFRKFFNHGDPDAEGIAMDGWVIVTDKMDGSLGILYERPDGKPAIATRGSFASEQALHATELFQQQYGNVSVPGDLTVCFEIIYPSNRIVVDYGKTDDLVLLGAVDIPTGASTGPNILRGWWPGPYTKVFSYASLEEALAAPPREGAEGLVVHFTGSDERLKLKQEDYVILHRLITGMNERVIWEHLAEGKDLRLLLEPVPEEFHSWIKDVASRLTVRAAQIITEARREFGDLLGELPEDYSRKDFALKAKDSRQAKYLFKLLDGGDIAPIVWRAIRPTGERGMVSGGDEE